MMESSKVFSTEDDSRFDGHEECDREGLVLVGEGDHHELAARPDVQVVGRHRELKQGAADRPCRSCRCRWGTSLFGFTHNIVIISEEYFLVVYITSADACFCLQ